jgi:hypothetical protein
LPAACVEAPKVKAPTAAKPNWIVQQLRASSHADMASWLAHAKELRMQVLVTIIRQAGEAKPRLQTHGHRVDAEYFYPASASKTFLAVAALRTLRRLSREKKRALPVSTRFMRCKSPAGRCEVPEIDEDRDPDDDDADEKLSIRREIHKMLAYSDNESYSRLFDLVGHQALHELSYESGFRSLRFRHRMSSRARPRTTRRVIVLPWRGGGFSLPQRRSELRLAATPAGRLDVGRAYRGPDGRVEAAMNFADKNYASLRDLHRLQLALLVPDADSGATLDLSPKERRVVIAAMAGPRRAAARLAGHKPLLPGLLKVVDRSGLRYVNKSGRAYGFHIDNAYVEDEKTGRAFVVTATIYGNPNGVLNDDDYAYEEITRPFMAALGEQLARAVFLAPPR